MGRIAVTSELLDYLSVKDGTKINVTMLDLMLDGAEQFVTDYTSRQFWPDPALDTDPPVTKSFEIGPATRSLRVPDLRSTDLVTIDGLTQTSGTDYLLEDASIEPATSIRFIYRNSLYSPWTGRKSSLVQIAGYWGFAAAPANIKDAVLTLAARRYFERAAMFSDAVQTPEGGVFNYFRNLPSTIRETLDLYRVPRVSLVAGPRAQTAVSY